MSMTGTYAINGIGLCPSTGRWLKRESIGIDGSGHPVYPATREFELKWDYLSADDFENLQTLYASVATTGTCVARLPQYAANSWTYYNYSGCVLNEPEVGEFFEEHYSDVVLLVTNIR